VVMPSWKYATARPAPANRSTTRTRTARPT
jgi:hypothetical protein